MNKQYKTDKLFLVKVKEVTKVINSNGKTKFDLYIHSHTLFAKIYQAEGQEPVYKLMLGKKQTLKTRPEQLSELGDLLICDLKKASEVFPQKTMTFSEIKNAEFKLNKNSRFHLQSERPRNGIPINPNKPTKIEFNKDLDKK